MNDGDPGRLEAELRRLAPARPPAEFMARLRAARAAGESEAMTSRTCVSNSS